VSYAARNKFETRNHPHQVGRRGALDDVDTRPTPSALFAPLQARFGFTLDAAASAENARCPTYFTIDDDGLAQDWSGHRVWCNPPYSRIRPWVRKAWDESVACPVIAMLLPANRTEQTWWQELVEPYRDRPGSRLRTEFLRGRIEFRAGSHAPFGCCLLVWEAAS
jgi:phage N-6-adenine-methyltransferase